MRPCWMCTINRKPWPFHLENPSLFQACNRPYSPLSQNISKIIDIYCRISQLPSLQCGGWFITFITLQWDLTTKVLKYHVFLLLHVGTWLTVTGEWWLQEPRHRSIGKELIDFEIYGHYDHLLFTMNRLNASTKGSHKIMIHHTIVWSICRLFWMCESRFLQPLEKKMEWLAGLISFAVTRPTYEVCNTLKQLCGCKAFNF